MELAATYSVPRLGLADKRARTLNMSRTGVLLECVEPVTGLVIGDLLEVVVELPAIHTRQARCIFSVGTIVRMENGGLRDRVALALEVMEFRDAEVTAVATSESISSFLM